MLLEKNRLVDGGISDCSEPPLIIFLHQHLPWVVYLLFQIRYKGIKIFNIWERTYLFICRHQEQSVKYLSSLLSILHYLILFMDLLSGLISIFSFLHFDLLENNLKEESSA